MLSWIRSWFSRPIPVEKDPAPKYEGPIIHVIKPRVLPEQYKINDKWWGTNLTGNDSAVKEQEEKKDEGNGSPEEKC